jgi:hypothetical protein
MNGKNSYGEVVIGNTTYDASGKMTGTLVTVIPQCFDKWRPEDDDYEDRGPSYPIYQDLYPRLFPQVNVIEAFEDMRIRFREKGRLLPLLKVQPLVPADHSLRLNLSDLSQEERHLMAYNELTIYWSSMLNIQDEASCEAALKIAFADVGEIYVVPAKSNYKQ